MTFDELLAQANNAQRKFLPKDKWEPISERTLRYWIAKGVLEKRTTRGPKTSYPESFVWRVVLTRQYQLSSSKTLAQIAEIQASTDDANARNAVETFTEQSLERPIQGAPMDRKSVTNKRFREKTPLFEVKQGAQEFNVIQQSITYLGEMLSSARGLLEQQSEQQQEFKRFSQDQLNQQEEFQRFFSREYESAQHASASLSMDRDDKFERIMQSQYVAEKKIDELAGTIRELTGEVHELKRRVSDSKEQP
jgi:hypothetical protein